MSPHEELFHRLLDESALLLAAPEAAGIVIPDDELHRENIVPLLPTMLADAAIRGHWHEQTASGFVVRIARHFENGDPAPRWTPGDFEIHVTASYSASPDARALADTLLSEESLREMTAALMNQLLDALWPKLAPVPVGVAAVEAAVAEAAPVEISEPPIPAVEVTPPVEAPVADEVPASVVQPTPQPPSRALIRAQCGKISASAFQRGFVASGALSIPSAAIIARRIADRAVTSPPPPPRRASL